MRSVTETFREWDFEDEFVARQRRDERMVELQAAGYDCSPKNLYALHNGQRVFTIDARLITRGFDEDDSFDRSGLSARRRGRSVRMPRVSQSERSKPKLVSANCRDRQRVTRVEFL